MAVARYRTICLVVIGKTWHFTFIHKATFTTNTGEVITCGGGNPGKMTKTEEARGYRLQYISGRSGEFLDSLRFHWSEQ